MRSFLLVLFLFLSLRLAAEEPSTRFEAVARQAGEARSQERIADAIQLYSEATGLRPGWDEGWWYLGSLLYDQDRFSEASAAFRHLDNSRYSGPTHGFLGLCAYENGDTAEALKQFRLWAGAGWGGPPSFRDAAIYHFALLLNREGLFVEALYLLDPLAKRFGDTAELTEAMGLASLRIKELPETLPPSERERVWLAGKAAANASVSPVSELVDEYGQRLEKRYPEQASVHYLRGRLYTTAKRPTEAEGEYREAIRLAPQDALALTALGTIVLDQAGMNEAEQLARRAIAADTRYAEAHHLLGRIALRNGDLKLSVKELEEARQLAPENPLIRAHLAMVYNKLGRTAEAKASQAAFLSLKNSADVMAPPRKKLDENPGETAH